MQNVDAAAVVFLHRKHEPTKRCVGAPIGVLGNSPWCFGTNWRVFGVDQGRSDATKRSVTRSGEGSGGNREVAFMRRAVKLLHLLCVSTCSGDIG